MNELDFILDSVTKMLGIFRVLGVLGIGLTAFGIYMIVSRNKSKSNDEPTVDDSPRKQYKKFPIVGIVVAMWFGISWMLSGLAAMAVGSMISNEYFKEMLNTGSVEVTINGDPINVTVPTNAPTGTSIPTNTPVGQDIEHNASAGGIITSPTPTPTLIPTAKPTEVPEEVQTGETRTFTLDFGGFDTNKETLDLTVPAEWIDDTAYISEYLLSFNYTDDLNVKYSCAYIEKGDEDRIKQQAKSWADTYQITTWKFANELNVEGSPDKSYIFGWETDYGTKYIRIFVAGSLKNYLLIEIKAFAGTSGLTWEEWQNAINVFMVTF